MFKRLKEKALAITTSAFSLSLISSFGVYLIQRDI
jgi:hypothetical protein